MRNYNLLLLLVLLVSCWNCAEPEFGMDEVEQTAIETIIMHYVAPPPTGNYLDSMKVAFVNALQVAGEANVDMIYDETRFVFREDNSFIAVVHWHPKDSLADLIYVNELLIQEYTLEGYLLIALHEWFHISRARNYNNDQGHAYMVVSTEYRTWIKRMFNCSDEEARWLVYVGTENTMVYNNLSAEEKAAVQIAYERFRIRRKK